MAPSWLRGRLLSDLAAGVVLAAAAVAAIGVEGQLGDLPGSACVVAFCALTATRGLLPLWSSLAAGVVMAVPFFANSETPVNNNASFIPVIVAAALLSYALGAHVSLRWSVAALVVLDVGIKLPGHPWNPVPLMVTLGPWFAGCLMASRQRAAALLRQQAEELAGERELFARETVRYERARIARELHDIVAHSVSMMVVQAGAGELLARSDPLAAAEAFASIARAADQAEEEIGRLVALLSADTAPTLGAVAMIDELVAHAQLSGLAVTYGIAGDVDDLGRAVGDTVVRAVQEAMTNAMKHAPGAPISIAVAAAEQHVEVRIVNAQARRRSSGLEHSGSGRGLDGMRERVLDCGGTCSVGPTPDRGWEVAIVLPRHQGARRLVP